MQLVTASISALPSEVSHWLMFSRIRRTPFFDIPGLVYGLTDTRYIVITQCVHHTSCCTSNGSNRVIDAVANCLRSMTLDC